MSGLEKDLEKDLEQDVRKDLPGAGPAPAAVDARGRGQLVAQTGGPDRGAAGPGGTAWSCEGIHYDRSGCGSP